MFGLEILEIYWTMQPMKPGLILVIFGVLQCQIVMPFSVFGSLKKLWPLIYQDIFIHIYCKVYILTKYTEEIYTNLKLSPVNVCIIIDVKVHTNSGNYIITSVRTSVGFPMYPSIPSIDTLCTLTHMHSDAPIWLTSFLKL